MVTPTPGHGRLRASHVDREHVVDVVAALIAAVLKAESRRQNRSRGQLPPRPTAS
jgi:hypothetical protein